MTELANYEEQNVTVFFFASFYFSIFLHTLGIPYFSGASASSSEQLNLPSVRLAMFTSLRFKHIIPEITYQKGAMMLRLLSDVIGAEPFRDGLQQLLRTHEYSTASHLDLFSCLNDVMYTF